MLVTDVTILHETRCSTVKADIVGTSQEFGCTDVMEHIR